MQRRSPLAFRRVRLSGFTGMACVAAGLSRHNQDLDEILTGGYPRELVARDLKRTMRDDIGLIAIYVAMLAAASAMASQAFSQREPLAFGILALLSVTAGIVDLLKNRGIGRALKFAHGDERDRAAAIRRLSLVKWTLLAALGFTLCTLLLYSGGRSGGRVLMASIAALLLFPFAAYCAGLIGKWWMSPGALW